jgi:4-alpha-glucanotransferase
MVHFEDILGQLDQPNLPGTVQEHPNWQRKLPLNLSDLLADPRLLALVGRIRSGRAGSAQAR